jgi:hypothetical protein
MSASGQKRTAGVNVGTIKTAVELRLPSNGHIAIVTGQETTGDSRLCCGTCASWGC